MKQLTCNVGIISLIHILVCVFSSRDLFQVTGTDASCILYIICFQFITSEQVTLCPAYCTWFVALLASPYAILLLTCPDLFLTQFDSSVTSEFSLSCPDCAKLALRTVIMSFHRWLSLLLKLKVIASI